VNLQRSISKQSATYQDVLDAPPNKVAEIIRGALHLQPRPAMPHAFAGSSLGDELTSPFQKGRGGPGGWWIVDEPELHLAEEVVVPDLAGWRRERMPQFPRTAYVTLAPNWICEILSHSTRALDVGPKRAIYRESGVGWLWLIDPEARSLEAFALREGAWSEIATLTGDEEVRMPPFDAISFPLAALWPDGEQVEDEQKAHE
jgi:Uma2 family endonuclease